MTTKPRRTAAERRYLAAMSDADPKNCPRCVDGLACHRDHAAEARRAAGNLALEARARSTR